MAFVVAALAVIALTGCSKTAAQGVQTPALAPVPAPSQAYHPPAGKPFAAYEGAWACKGVDNSEWGYVVEPQGTGSYSKETELFVAHYTMIGEKTARVDLLDTKTNQVVRSLTIEFLGDKMRTTNSKTGEVAIYEFTPPGPVPEQLIPC